MLRTMNWLIGKYNKTAKTENARRKAHNSEICKRIVLEDITAAEAVVLTGFGDVPERSSVKRGGLGIRKQTK